MIHGGSRGAMTRGDRGRISALRKEHRERWCWHPHQLRHNYATMIRKQFGIEEASNMLDHSSVKMTEVYAERDREQALEIARQVG